MSVTSKAIWYVESHLDADVGVEAVAASVGVSRFHLSRAFSLSTGMPLAAYARARRLTVAAQALAAGAPDILTLALEAGYGSHEAFTRAFRQHFAMTPEQFRTRADEAAPLFQEPFSMQSTHPPVALPAPRIVSRDAILIFGMSITCSVAGDPNISRLWSRAVPHLCHIPGTVGNYTYGVCHNSDDAGSFDYTAGVEVSTFPNQPPEFTRLRIPPQTYAVFEHREHISSVVATWKAIFDTGLAAAGCKAADAPAFEAYGEQFDGMTGNGGLEIWIPVIHP